eukprot:Mrub_11612.p1 GENE.Mrub_11612~~Mrub_11612.p1  ORF type:complete len:149 (+),score=12.30 Mrub_11612:2-448(+)
MVTCMRNNTYLNDFLTRQTNDELQMLYSNYEKITEEIEHIFHRFDDDGNGTLELDEFESVCRYIDPELSKDMINSLYKSMVDKYTKSVNIQSFKDFFIPIFRSKVEYELFTRKVINKGRTLGADDKKLEQMTKYIDEIQLTNNYRVHY